MSRAGFAPPAGPLSSLSATDQLARDLKSARQRNDILTRAVLEMAGSPTVVGVHNIDGQLTVVMKSGAVWQRQTRAIDAPGCAGFVLEWQQLDAIPGSRARTIQDLEDLEPESPEAVLGMSVVA